MPRENVTEVSGGAPSTRPKRRVEGCEAFQEESLMVGSLRTEFVDGSLYCKLMTLRFTSGAAKRIHH